MNVSLCHLWLQYFIFESGTVPNLTTSQQQILCLVPLITALAATKQQYSVLWKLLFSTGDYTRGFLPRLLRRPHTLPRDQGVY